MSNQTLCSQLQDDKYFAILQASKPINVNLSITGQGKLNAIDGVMNFSRKEPFHHVHIISNSATNLFHLPCILMECPGKEITNYVQAYFCIGIRDIITNYLEKSCIIDIDPFVMKKITCDKVDATVYYMCFYHWNAFGMCLDEYGNLRTNVSGRLVY